MCVLHVSFGSKVRSRTVGCVAMHSAVLFIFRSRLLLYSAGSGVNRVRCFVWISCEIIFFVQSKTVCIFLGYTRPCMCRCDGDVICVGYDLNWCSWWWYVCNVYIE